MSHEARINDALRQLGEEFRLGMIAAEEYRARRRKLVESWGERDATTSPGSARSTLPGMTPPKAAAPAPAPARGGKPTAAFVTAGVVLVAAIAGGAWLMLGGGGPADRPAAVAPDPEVLAARQAADEFLARNEWNDAAIAGFLAKWRALTPQDRALARDEPSVRRLQYRLDENIKAESQLLTPDAPPARRARLEMLEAFAAELSGGGA